MSVDIGARHLAVAIGDLGHRVLARRWIPLEHGHDVENGLHAAGELVDELLATASIDRRLVIGTAVGLPAPITHPDEIVASSNILPGWSGVQLANELTERLGMTAVVDNDANLGALAEAKWGAGAGGEQVAYIKVATGIGAGLIHDGRLFRGVAGTAGEIGHMTVSEDGPVCRCGNRGCLELYAGGEAILTSLQESEPDVATVDRLVDLALEGDQRCRAGDRRLRQPHRRSGGQLSSTCSGPIAWSSAASSAGPATSFSTRSAQPSAGPRSRPPTRRSRSSAAASDPTPRYSAASSS